MDEGSWDEPLPIVDASPAVLPSQLPGPVGHRTDSSWITACAHPTTLSLPVLRRTSSQAVIVPPQADVAPIHEQPRVGAPEFLEGWHQSSGAWARSREPSGTTHIVTRLL